MEIEVLKVLWVESAATSSEIYAQLDSTIRITSQDLQKILEQMADRGLLDRKKISPSHEFTFFGIAKIELSSKNRKNKLYLYWPLLRKGKLITYLDAKRYLALSSSETTSTNGRPTLAKRLEEKLYRLLE
ncbi:BlaI/MecI/CopY family transcriptional regulator [candidate division KSB1 bacterium]|nr:BlaI/MecI/CopY family transcriptional regulator [candidate division KSB1 bacterium]